MRCRSLLTGLLLGATLVAAPSYGQSSFYGALQKTYGATSAITYRVEAHDRLHSDPLFGFDYTSTEGRTQKQTTSAGVTVPFQKTRYLQVFGSHMSDDDKESASGGVNVFGQTGKTSFRFGYERTDHSLFVQEYVRSLCPWLRLGLLNTITHSNHYGGLLVHLRDGPVRLSARALLPGLMRTTDNDDRYLSAVVSWLDSRAAWRTIVEADAAADAYRAEFRGVIDPWGIAEPWHYATYDDLRKRNGFNVADNIGKLPQTDGTFVAIISHSRVGAQETKAYRAFLTMRDFLLHYLHGGASYVVTRDAATTTKYLTLSLGGKILPPQIYGQLDVTVPLKHGDRAVLFRVSMNTDTTYKPEKALR